MSSFTQCIARTAIGLAALSAACSVQAFADDDARRAILELRESIKTLQTDLEANRNAQIQLSTEINNLKELNRRLTGRIEELLMRRIRKNAMPGLSTKRSTSALPYSNLRLW